MPNIPDEIIARIIAQWLDIQEAMTLADQLWRKDPRQAALALAYAWGEFAAVSARTREAIGEPNVRPPMDTVSHLTAALLDRHAVDPMCFAPRTGGTRHWASRCIPEHGVTEDPSASSDGIVDGARPELKAQASRRGGVC